MGCDGVGFAPGTLQSTAHRFLITLQEYGFVQRTPARRYRIGVRNLELGNVFRFDRKFLLHAEPCCALWP